MQNSLREEFFSSRCSATLIGQRMKNLGYVSRTLETLVTMPKSFSDGIGWMNYDTENQKIFLKSECKIKIKSISKMKSQDRNPIHQ